MTKFVTHPTERIDESNDKVPLFWKLFGGSVFSIIVILMLSIFGYVVSSVQSVQGDLNRLNREVASLGTTSTDLKERIKANELRGEELRLLQEKLLLLEKSSVTLTEDNKTLREQISQLRERLAKIEKPVAEKPQE